MTTLTKILGETGFRTPRLDWRALLGRLAALDALHRERGRLAELDDRILRDIGVTRADVAETLRRPEEHLRLIVRRGHQL